MMFKIKFAVFICLFMTSVILNGQNNINTQTNDDIDIIKSEIYESLINHQELKKDKTCHIITIIPVSLQMKHSFGFLDSFYDIERVKDTTSIAKLREALPDSYKVYAIDDAITNVAKSSYYISLVERSDTIYTKQKNTTHYYVPTYDIIKIYEPFDMWYSLYTSVYRDDLRNINIIIPVVYEDLQSGIVIEEKYLLFKVKYDLTDGEFKISKL